MRQTSLEEVKEFSFKGKTGGKLNKFKMSASQIPAHKAITEILLESRSA